MIDHRRPDLDYMPCDTEPAHACGCSPYLCPWCNPRRSLIAAIRDVSAFRDLPVSYFELIRPRSNVLSLAAARERRRNHA